MARRRACPKCGAPMYETDQVCLGCGWEWIRSEEAEPSAEEPSSAPPPAESGEVFRYAPPTGSLVAQYALAMGLALVAITIMVLTRLCEAQYDHGHGAPPAWGLVVIILVMTGLVGLAGAQPLALASRLRRRGYVKLESGGVALRRATGGEWFMPWSRLRKVVVHDTFRRDRRPRDVRFDQVAHGVVVGPWIERRDELVAALVQHAGLSPSDDVVFGATEVYARALRPDEEGDLVSVRRMAVVPAWQWALVALVGAWSGSQVLWCLWSLVTWTPLRVAVQTEGEGQGFIALPPWSTRGTAEAPLTLDWCFTLFAATLWFVIALAPFAIRRLAVARARTTAPRKMTPDAWRSSVSAALSSDLKGGPWYLVGFASAALLLFFVLPLLATGETEALESLGAWVFGLAFVIGPPALIWLGARCRRQTDSPGRQAWGCVLVTVGCLWLGYVLLLVVAAVVMPK